MILGGDFSKWQDANSTPQKVDFFKAKAAGMEFVIIKASQAAWTDEDFLWNWENAKLAGLLRGAYHFMVWDVDPVQQADYFWGLLKNDPPDMPPVVDFEWWNTTPANALDILKRFVTRLEQLCGRPPIIYTAAGFWQPYGSTDPWWKRFPLWVAHYDVSQPLIPLPWKNYTFWQWSSHGDGPKYGAESLNVDLDFWPGTLDELRAFCGKVPEGEEPMTDKCLMVSLYNDDLNVVTPSADFAALAKQGAEAFILRLCGSKDGVNPWIDSTYPARYTEARKTGRAVGALIKLHPKYDEEYYTSPNAQGADRVKWTMQLIREAQADYKPDFYVIMDETPSWKNSAGGMDNCTPVNHIKCLDAITNELWNKYRKPVFVETAEWVEKTYWDAAQQTNLLGDWASNNCVESNERFPLILVSYHNDGQPIADLKTHMDGLLFPTGTELVVNLSVGNATFRGWEQTRFTQTTLGGKARLIVFRGDAKTLYETFLLKTYPGPYTGQQPGADTTPPTCPAPMAGNMTSEGLLVSWQASTDNVGVAGYRVYRDGVKIAETDKTEILEVGLDPGKPYMYEVEAFDAAGNVSQRAGLQAQIGTGDFSKLITLLQKLQADVSAIRSHFV